MSHASLNQPRDGYELIDFGESRKLERFGDYLIDRPYPAARGKRCHPQAWSRADSRFERTNSGKGHWRSQPDFPATWTTTVAAWRMELRLTPAGQVGVFPEQRSNWEWISQRTRHAQETLRILNLFGYTGGSTIAAALGNTEVTHVDASRSAVLWAKRNAVFLEKDVRVRWIVDDARRFVTREVARGRQYDGLILDPPTYGHGPRGEAWKIATDLGPLLRMCRRLLADQPKFILLTCHSPGFEAAELQALVDGLVFGSCLGGAVGKALCLTTSDERRLAAGAVARWSGVT